ncbi:MAG TPA: SDR family oxidoreductase [Actinocrinis sp.]|nr:SDR family oxidoreductase [Actinocrinis sp.]
MVLRTDAGDGLEGHAFAFTIGRGNDVQVAALGALRGHVLGRDLAALCADPGSLSRDLVGDSQLRWLGPEKGVMHMAIGAVVNAAWDLAAKHAGKPLWQFLADADPAWLVGQVDFRYIADALSPEQALELLLAGRAGAADRERDLRARGYPAYTISPGWLGYSDEKLTRLARAAVADGFTQIKLKVGADLDDDVRRLKAARTAVGPGIRIAVDANQRWGVQEAVAWTRALTEFDPYWIEEPTSPDGLPDPLTGFVADVSDDASVRAGVAAAAEAVGGLDILVNNAGIGATGSVADNPDEQWHRVLDVNVVGMVRVTRAALGHLRASQHASIVNVCSIAATAGLPQRALYSASKGAVLSLTLAMAADHVREGIRVNCVNPGTVDTPWVGRLLDEAADPAAERSALGARQPTGRLVSAEEVAGAIAYLAGPAAGSTTGTALAVDGGMAGLRLRPAA